jgi:hypothetical protein
MLRIISHRGNLNGPGQRENHPAQIDTCLESGFESEVDLWVRNGRLFLGHDFGIYKIDFEWLRERQNLLWVHCKNIESLLYLTEIEDPKLNYFWHQNDNYTLTSTKKIWVFPGQALSPGCIAVLPEIWLKEEWSSELSNCFAICTDFPEKFKKVFAQINH